MMRADRTDRQAFGTGDGEQVDRIFVLKLGLTMVHLPRCRLVVT